jgi:hypothetical protein
LPGWPGIAIRKANVCVQFDTWNASCWHVNNFFLLQLAPARRTSQDCVKDQPRHTPRRPLFVWPWKRGSMPSRPPKRSICDAYAVRSPLTKLLARFFAERHAPWLLKGGYAMHFRSPSIPKRVGCRAFFGRSSATKRRRITGFGCRVQAFSENFRSRLGDLGRFRDGVSKSTKTSAGLGGAGNRLQVHVPLRSITSALPSLVTMRNASGSSLIPT